jgi:undecaprenyl diphosphate synthase
LLAFFPYGCYDKKKVKKMKKGYENNFRRLSEQKLSSMIDPQNLPRHVAIIMDGNGRWARARLLPRMAGHRVGMSSALKIVEVASNLGIEVLTLYAFSVENWRRPAEEVNSLMKLLVEYLKRELISMQRNNIRFQAIGRINGLPAWVQQQIEWAVEKTHNNTGMLLNVALNYGGRAEIIDAVKEVLKEIKDNRLDPNKLDEEAFSGYLYTTGLPDPDLLIRTSGELRISNFLLWQLAYTELVITPTLWPDFRQREFLQAILEYQKRERRFGDVCKLAQSK